MGGFMINLLLEKYFNPTSICFTYYGQVLFISFLEVLIKNKTINLNNDKILNFWNMENNDWVLTNYAFHTVGESSISRASKKTKKEVIRLLETLSDAATTWVWNYKQSNGIIGEDVEVLKGSTEKYLRLSNSDRITDNLGQLIDYEWTPQ